MSAPSLRWIRVQTCRYFTSVSVQVDDSDTSEDEEDNEEEDDEEEDDEAMDEDEDDDEELEEVAVDQSFRLELMKVLQKQNALVGVKLDLGF